MPTDDWIILAVATLGVLHGPLGAQLLAWLKSRQGKR